MVIFETPQSSRVKMKVTLERTEAGLHDVDLEDLKLLNPYNMIITIPSKILDYQFIFSVFSSISGSSTCKGLNKWL